MRGLFFYKITKLCSLFVLQLDESGAFPSAVGIGVCFSSTSGNRTEWTAVLELTCPTGYELDKNEINEMMNSFKSNYKKNKVLNPRFGESSSECDNSLSRVQFIFSFDSNYYSRDTFCLQLNLYRFYKVSNLYAGKIAVYDIQNGRGRRAEEKYILQK
jgi:hypothetical protein